MNLLIFVTFMNNGKVFPSLDGMQLAVYWPASDSTTSLGTQKVLNFLRPWEIWFIKK